MKITAAELATKTSVDKALCYGFLRFLVAQGSAVAGTIKAPGVKGRRTVVYEVLPAAEETVGNLLRDLAK